MNEEIKILKAQQRDLGERINHVQLNIIPKLEQRINKILGSIFERLEKLESGQNK